MLIAVGSFPQGQPQLPIWARRYWPAAELHGGIWQSECLQLLADACAHHAPVVHAQHPLIADSKRCLPQLLELLPTSMHAAAVASRLRFCPGSAGLSLHLSRASCVLAAQEDHSLCEARYRALLGRVAAVLHLPALRGLRVLRIDMPGASVEHFTTLAATARLLHQMEASDPYHLVCVHLRVAELPARRRRVRKRSDDIAVQQLRLSAQCHIQSALLADCCQRLMKRLDLKLQHGGGSLSAMLLRESARFSRLHRLRLSVDYSVKKPALNLSSLQNVRNLTHICIHIHCSDVTRNPLDPELLQDLPQLAQLDSLRDLQFHADVDSATSSLAPHAANGIAQLTQLTSLQFHGVPCTPVTTRASCSQMRLRSSLALRRLCVPPEFGNCIKLCLAPLTALRHLTLPHKLHKDSDNETGRSHLAGYMTVRGYWFLAATLPQLAHLTALCAQGVCNHFVEGAAYRAHTAFLRALGSMQQLRLLKVSEAECSRTPLALAAHHPLAYSSGRALGILSGREVVACRPQFPYAPHKGSRQGS